MLRKSMQFFSAFLLTVLLLGGGSLSSPVALAAEQVLPEVYAGGQTIGILLKSQGVTVVGLAPVTEQDGQTTNPAETAGIKIGDFIITINGKEITGDEQLSALIDRAGQEGQNCQIEFLRNGEKKNAEITPLFSQDTGGYRIGLYVRDNMAGVGTLTFYEPQSGLYGALGHEVDNAHLAQDGTALGQIIKAPISGIRVAESGAPGEKIGVFIGNPTGTITKNSIYGLFGKCKQLPDPLYLRNPIPVAFCHQVTTGPAEILTVVDGEKIEAFTINIVKTMANYKSSGKGMVIEVTDERLIQLTGGIIQGMSGSPIIQNGMLAGAVTHVFVKDPLHGYGCFAEWMLAEAGLCL